MTREESLPVAQRLREERLHHRWSQQELADHLGTTAVTISRWENGVSKPSPYFRLKLAQLFGKPIDEFVETSDRENIDEAQRDGVPQDFLPRTVVDATVTDQPLLPHHPKEAMIPIEGSLLPPQKSWLARRKLVACLASGVVAASVGGWWLETFLHRTPPAVASSPSVEVVYRSSPGKLIYVNYVAWSPLGHFIACADGNKTAQILDAATGTVKMVYRGHMGFVDCVTWAPDETRVASASADKTVQVWKTKTGEPVLTYKGHTAGVHVVSWSHNGTLLASGGTDTTVQVWDAFSGQKIQTYTGHTKSVWNIEWSPDDESIASGGEDGIIHIWNPMTAHPSPTFVYQGPKSRINEISWSPNGKYLGTY